MLYTVLFKRQTYFHLLRHFLHIFFKVFDVLERFQPIDSSNKNKNNIDPILKYVLNDSFQLSSTIKSDRRGVK